ncbi:4,5-DOPA dioxygenase extradiol [Corynebacterium sp. A21]|uniref:4,5-DOPA-extradiol-dioxygenase n=1 Tax=Corynebacterium sp. A21 TaxID=3457318 RepID=UPI003FCFC33E
MTTKALFVGHGTPMNAIEDNEYTNTWKTLGSEISGSAPRAILSVSAHWYTRGTGVTAMTNPKTIHDFWGFPPELNAVQYDAPGDPEIAELVKDIAKPTLVQEDYNWGLDHGTWSVLKHMFPEAKIPVVQLSIDGTKTFADHVSLGNRLARLAEEHNVLIVGSGNVVHNLSMVQWHAGNTGFDWADRFDAAAKEIMLGDPDRAESLLHHENFRQAVPTPDHFLPLAYVAGATAALKNSEVSVFNDERTMGSMSMTGYQVSS